MNIAYNYKNKAVFLGHIMKRETLENTKIGKISTKSGGETEMVLGGF